MTGSSLFLSSVIVHEGVIRRSEAVLSDVTLTGISAVVEKLIWPEYALPLFVVPVWYRRCDDDVVFWFVGGGRRKKVLFLSSSVVFRLLQFFCPSSCLSLFTMHLR